MSGKHHLLTRRLLVIAIGTWLPVATMAVPPSCCFPSQMFYGSAATVSCCLMEVSPESSSPSDLSDHSPRRCGCSFESMNAKLPAVVVVVNSAEDLSTGWHAQATQPALDGQLAYADVNLAWFLGLARPRSSTETCAALCRFLC